MPTKAEMNEILNSIDEFPHSDLYDDNIILEGIVISEDMTITESQIINEGIMSWLGKKIGGGIGDFFMGAFKDLIDSYGRAYGTNPDQDPEAAKAFFGVDGVKQLMQFMNGYAKDLNSIATRSKAFLKLDPGAGDKIKNILKVAIKDGQAVMSGYAAKIKEDMNKQFDTEAGKMGGGAGAGAEAPAEAKPEEKPAEAPAGAEKPAEAEAAAPAAPAAAAAAAPAPAAPSAKKPVAEMTPEERAAAATAAKAKKESTPATESRNFNKLSGSGIELLIEKVK